jgi:hypothetical protein
MARFNRKIAVTLIDDVTNEPIGVTKMLPADLPETFERETTLHIGDVDWSVVNATPKTRPEYSKSGTLTLRLRRIEKADLRNILYSLPSICDSIPPLGNEPLSGNECLLAEDDWRQFEMVAQQFTAEADAEIEAIRRIHEQASAEVGSREIHVRRRPDPPIAGALTLRDVSRAFGAEIAFGGVSYHGAGARIESGYSFTAPDGLRCYGLAQGGRVTVFGIAQQAVDSPPSRSVDCLAEIAREFNLNLVHWCRCVRASWTDPLFRQLLIENVA